MTGVQTCALPISIAELPTVAESGVPGYASGNWYGFLTTAGTPRAVMTKINADVLKALADKNVRTRFSRQGMEPSGSTPDDFARFIKSEAVKYAKVVKTAGIRTE